MNITDKGVWTFWMTDSLLYPMAIWICRKCDGRWTSRRNRLPKKCPYCGEEDKNDREKDREHVLNIGILSRME